MLTFGQSRIKETHLKKKKKKNVDIMVGTQQIFQNEWWSLAKNPSFSSSKWTVFTSDTQSAVF